MLPRFLAAPRCALYGPAFIFAVSIAAIAADSPTITAKPSQTAFAMLRVSAIRPQAMPASDDKFDPAEFAICKQRQAAVLKSFLVAKKALNDKSVQELPVVKEHGVNAPLWIANQIVVDSPPNSEEVRVGMATADRESARLIVNAVVDAYMSEVIERERTDRLNLRDSLNKKLLLYKNNLMSKKRDLFELEQQMGVVRSAEAPDEGWVRSEVADLEKQTVEMRRARVQAKLQVARAKLTLASLNEWSPDYKSAVAALKMAEMEQRFWTDELAAIPAEHGKLKQTLAGAMQFNGNAEALRVDIAELNALIQEMAKSLDRMNVELDLDSRVTVIQRAQ